MYNTNRLLKIVYVNNCLLVLPIPNNCVAGKSVDNIILKCFGTTSSRTNNRLLVITAFGTVRVVCLTEIEKYGTNFNKWVLSYPLGITCTPYGHTHVTSYHPPELGIGPKYSYII